MSDRHPLFIYKRGTHSTKNAQTVLSGQKVAPRQRSRKNNYLCGMEKPEYALSLAKAAQELDEYFAGRRETGRPRFYTSIFLTGVFSFEPSGENRVRGKYQRASLLNQLPFNQSLLYSCDI